MCRKDPFLRQWNPSIQKSSFILSRNTVHSINSFIISKTVVLDDHLMFKVYVADVMCNLEKIGYNIPPVIYSAENLFCLLNILSGSRLCFGCQNVDFMMLGSEILEGEGIIGRMKCVSSFNEKGALSEKEQRYFSSSCHALMHHSRTKSSCEACESLDRILRQRLFRLRSNDILQTEARKANHRYLSMKQLQDSLVKEKLLRRNAERRQQYAKKRLDSERHSKQLTIQDHEDMSAMFCSITASKDHEKLFADKPDMKFFWNLQREMMENKTRKWHPRYNIHCIVQQLISNVTFL